MQTLQHYQARFTAHLRQPEQHKKPLGINDKRMRIYREIVFNNFLASVSACFPVLQSVLGKRAFSKLARHCFSKHHFGSPLFKDIPKAFVAFLQTQNLAVLNLPPFTAQLAHYEWVELFVSQLQIETITTPAATINDATDLADCFLQLQPAHMLVHYEYPVQQISKKQRNLPPTPTYLLVFRTPDFKIEFIQLNVATFQLLQRVQSEPAIVSAHVESIAQTLLPHLPLESVQAFGLQSLHALYLQHAIVIKSSSTA